MRRSVSRSFCLAFALATGCGTPTFDMAGYPDAAHDRLYRDGRLGDDKGLVDFDLRKAWRAVTQPADRAE